MTENQGLDDKLGQELQAGLKQVSVTSLKRSCSAIETQSEGELLCPKITHTTYLEMILQRGHQYQMAPARPAEVTNQGATATPQLSGTSPGLHAKAQGSWLQAALLGERSRTLKSSWHRRFKNDRTMWQDIDKMIILAYLFPHQTVHFLELGAIWFFHFISITFFNTSRPGTRPRNCSFSSRTFGNGWGILFLFIFLFGYISDWKKGI